MDSSSKYKARILDCAANILADQGVDFLTVSHIVQQCSISKRSFYEVFPSKQSLIDELNRSLDHSSQIQNELDIVVECASQGFAKYGFAAFDMVKLSKISGINRSSIYRYFKTKEKLFEHCAVQLMDHLQQIALSNLSCSEQPDLSLKRYIADYCKYAGECKYSNLLAECYALAKHNTALAKCVRTFESSLLRLYIDHFHRGVEMDRFRKNLDVEGTAILMQMILNGVVFFVDIDSSGDLFGRVKDNIISLIENAIEAPAESDGIE